MAGISGLQNMNSATKMYATQTKPSETVSSDSFIHERKTTANFATAMDMRK